jgi:hypothetical protein
MNNDFDFPPDFDFEDLDGGLEDLEAFEDEAAFEELVVRTAVLQKNNMVALLCIKSAAEGAAICRVDPRENVPSVQLYDDPNAALEWFIKSLRSSRRNGWNIVYDGLPLQG